MEDYIAFLTFVCIIGVVFLFLIWHRLGILKDLYNLLYAYINQVMLRLEEFNPDEVKILRYLLLDLDKIMPFIVEKKQYEKRKWDFEEEDRKQEEEMRNDVEFMRFCDKIDKEKEKKKDDETL